MGSLSFTGWRGVRRPLTVRHRGNIPRVLRHPLAPLAPRPEILKAPRSFPSPAVSPSFDSFWFKQNAVLCQNSRSFHALRIRLGIKCHHLRHLNHQSHTGSTFHDHLDTRFIEQYYVDSTERRRFQPRYRRDNCCQYSKHRNLHLVSREHTSWRDGLCPGDPRNRWHAKL
jgi:hypothetical protein